MVSSACVCVLEYLQMSDSLEEQLYKYIQPYLAGVDERVHPADDLGFGRIVVSETEAPNMLANLV